MKDQLLPASEVAVELSRLLGTEVSGDVVRQWFRKGRSPAGPLIPDERVGQLACLRASTVTLLAATLKASGWRPGQVGRRPVSANDMPGWLPTGSIEALEVSRQRAVALKHIVETYVDRLRTLHPDEQELASLASVLAAVCEHQNRMTRRINEAQ
ncbi:hypothetical protein [Actinomadura sp. 6N118]|uniref:hypothetical protein n=1 Tax=Actinomadura sp. 6N118 TaxID=3375151 RepID=UPI00378AE395